jgi:hypothetical protein
MSLPQIVDAFICTSTSPWPGLGTSNSLISTPELPGRIAPIILEGMLIGWSFGTRLIVLPTPLLEAARLPKTEILRTDERRMKRGLEKRILDVAKF